MLMRPAPPQATGPSPRTNTRSYRRQETIHPDPQLSPSTPEPRIGPNQPQPQPQPRVLLEEHPAYRPPHPEFLRPERPRETESGDGVPPARNQVEDPGAAATCGKCVSWSRPGHRSVPCRSKRSRAHAGDEKARRRAGHATPDAERSRDIEIPDPDDRRVPFHAAFADDPAFHRLDQEVVADDNTEENRPRRATPRSDYSCDCLDEVRRLGEIAETRTAADGPEHVAGRTQGSRHRQRRKASSIRKDEKKEEEEDKVYESGRRPSAESAGDFDAAIEEDAEVARFVAEVPEAARSGRRGFRKRRTSRVDEKTGSLLFVLYLLALPIMCATNGSPPGDRGPLAFSKNAHNSSPEGEERHPYRDYSWEVNQINPWLSACDLAGPAPADLQGSCGPPETPKNCPDACRKTDVRASRAADSFFAVVSQANEHRDGGGGGGGVPRSETGGRAAPEQCLFYLEESHKTEICRDDFGKESSARSSTVRENRYRFLSGLRLRHCCEHAALNALASGDGGPLEEVLGGNEGCRKAIGKLLAVDALAARLHCEFGEVLARYDCGQPYSVIYNCSHCKEAYRRWVCSSLVPYFAHDDNNPRQKRNQGLAGSRRGTGMRIRPCRSFCQTVEQRCPYLLPGDRAPAYPTQYAGEPTFLCRDPNIPETGEQASRALHADEECCFHVCSDEDPGRGVCANCTEPQVEIAIRGGNAQRDPSTAPQCELNSASSSTSGHHQSTTSSGTWSGTVSTTESGTLVNPRGSDGVSGPDVSSGPSSQQSSSSSSSSSGTSFCGSGGVGSMSSSSSPRVAPPSVIMCAFCAWGALLGLCTIKLATSWTTSESSQCPKDRTSSIRVTRVVNRGRSHGHHYPRRGCSPPENRADSVLVLSCSLTRSFFLGLREVLLSELSPIAIIMYDYLFKIKLKKFYDEGDDPLIDEDRLKTSSSLLGFRSRNRNLRRRSSPGKQRRRKKKKTQTSLVA